MSLFVPRSRAADTTTREIRAAATPEFRRLPSRSQIFAALQPAAHPVLILALLSMAPLAFSQQGTVKGTVKGTISGTVVDANGGPVAGAQVTLSMEGGGPDRQALSTDAGAFSFPDVAPGPFRVSVTGKGFAVKTIADELHAGEALSLPPTALALETVTTEVNVTPAPAETAEAEIKLEETQRFVGLIPNYFVNYDPDAAPLQAKQKFELSWKTFLDPSTFAVTGILAGEGQLEHTHKGFGQGVEGYAKRYGTSYGDFAASVLIDRAIMPIVFKQDPRYFYKGTGGKRSRFLYAVSRSVICQGDNKKAQFCYSSILGRFASGFLVNLSYPASDRNSPGVTLENGAIGIGGHALGNLFQEFIARRLTRKKP